MTLEAKVKAVNDAEMLALRLDQQTSDMKIDNFILDSLSNTRICYINALPGGGKTFLCYQLVTLSQNCMTDNNKSPIAVYIDLSGLSIRDAILQTLSVMGFCDTEIAFLKQQPIIFICDNYSQMSE